MFFLYIPTSLYFIYDQVILLKQKKRKIMHLKPRKQPIRFNIADQIGILLRNNIIQSRKRKSCERNSYCESKNKIKTFHSPQGIFWTNPYKIKKSQWNFSKTPKFSVHQKQQISYCKEQQLQRFKRKLRTQSEKRQSMKQMLLQENITRVREFRQNSHYSRQQKFQIFMNQKQKDADNLRVNLQRKRFEANVRKRQNLLQHSYSRQQRHQQKLAKNKNKILQIQNFKTTN